MTPARTPEPVTAPPPVIPPPEIPIPATDPPSSDRGPGRPRDERATSAITDAAVRQLNVLGYANVSMESVAAEAGVARATVYRRYRDKADLITAAIAASSATHLDSLPSEDVRSDLIAYLTLHRQRVVEPNMKYAHSLLIRAVELGLLGPDADLDLALQMLMGAVFARRMSGTPSTPKWAERAVDTVLAGMRNG